MLFFGVGAVGITILSAMWVISRQFDAIEVVHLHDRAIFYYCIVALLLGSQFLLAGLLAELVVWRTHRRRDVYSIAQRRVPRRSGGGRGAEDQRDRREEDAHA
jgi:dolichol-phosphate mannosyltransferase